MSVTLTTDQFNALLEKSSTKPKLNKTELAKRTNAMNMDEFIAGMKFISISKLITMELPDFIAHTIMANVSPIEDDELPFACSNSQTKTFYYKENNEWKKGNEFMKMLYNVICKDAFKQVMSPKYSSGDTSKNQTDDDVMERMYVNSRECEKQRILCNLCNCEKYPHEKCVEKALSKLAKSLCQ